MFNQLGSAPESQIDPKLAKALREFDFEKGDVKTFLLNARDFSVRYSLTSGFAIKLFTALLETNFEKETEDEKVERLLLLEEAEKRGDSLEEMLYLKI